MLRLSIAAIDVWNGSMMGENTKMIELPSVLPWGVPLVYVWKHSNCLLRIPRCNVCFLDSFLFSLLQSFLNFAVRFKNIKPLIRCGLSLNDLSGYRVFIHGKIIKRNFLIALKASPMKYVQSPIFCQVEDEYLLLFCASLWGSSSSSLEITFAHCSSCYNTVRLNTTMCEQCFSLLLLSSWRFRLPTAATFVVKYPI